MVSDSTQNAEVLTHLRGDELTGAARPSRSLWKVAWRRFIRNKIAVVSAAVRRRPVTRKPSIDACANAPVFDVDEYPSGASVTAS